MNIIIDFLNMIVEFIQNSGTFGVIISVCFIFVESILPVLPLSVFITINFMVLGPLIGFIISWIFTVLGCIMSYTIFRKGLGNKFDNLTSNKKLLNKYKHLFRNISTTKLLLIIAMPFTPAFVVNIVCGLIKMDFKKYFIALLFGKIAMVYFWGFVGTSLVESINNPIILLKIVLIMSITYLLYVILRKVLKFE